MRKIFIGLLSWMVVLSSCSHSDELIDTENGEYVETRIQVAIPAESNALTRAALDRKSENSGINNVDADDYSLRYILEIWNADADPTTDTPVFREIKAIDIDENAKSISFTATLLKGKAYDFVAWADITLKSAPEADHHYITTKLTEIKLDETKLTLNDDSKDAFCAYVQSNITGSINMILKRPLGKIRFITTDYGTFSDAEKASVVDNVRIAYYSAAGSTLYTEFNAMTGVVNPEAKLTGQTVAQTGVPCIVSADGQELCMFWDYVFVPEDPLNEGLRLGLDIRSKLDPAATTLTAAYCNDPKIRAKRNILTTVRGTLFSFTKTISISIDDKFEDYLSPVNKQIFIDDKPYETIAQAMADAISGETIKLREGVFNEDVTLKAGVTLEGMGETSVITGYVQMAAGSTLKDVRSFNKGVKSDGATTIYSVLNVNGKNITIDGVIFETTSDAKFIVSKSKQFLAISTSGTTEGFVFKNSTISEPYWKGLYLNSSKEVTISNNTFNYLNPFSTDAFDETFEVTGNTFKRKGLYNTRMPHIMVTGLASPVTAAAITGKTGLEDFIGQLKEDNTWIEEDSSTGGGTSAGNYTKVVKINSTYVGKAGTDATGWYY